MFCWGNKEDLGKLVGRTLVSATGSAGADEMVLTTDDGVVFTFKHDQDCCETVSIADVVGDLSDLIGMPILRAEERSSADEEPRPSEWAESWTWTFYELATNKGSVTVRWLGESNGYYSESVSLYITDPAGATQ